MDAWVYLAHGHLFANAQTGNVVLFAIHAAAGEMSDAAHFVPSITAFAVGLLSSRLVGAWLKKKGLNSRNVRLSAECVVLLILALAVGKLPNGIVAACVGFVAAIQITSLSHIGSAGFNTGMTTGNLRGAVSAAVATWLDPSSRENPAKAATLGWMCLSFVAGALAGGSVTYHFGDGTVFVIAGLVASAVLVMWRTPDPIPAP